MPSSCGDSNRLKETKSPPVTLEKEDEWRELLQKQLADHWLKLNYPEEVKHKNVILDKIRGSGARVA